MFNYNQTSNYKGGNNGLNNSFNPIYNLNSICRVKNSEILVTIIRIGREQYECRLPDASTRWFYEYELELVSEGTTPGVRYNRHDIKHQFKYKVGDVVNNGRENVTIIRIGREQYECRLPNMNTCWFYEDELTLV